MSRVWSVFLVFFSISVASAEVTVTPAQTAKLMTLESYGQLPLSFEVNQGQTNPRVKFLSRGPGYTLFLTATEAVLALRHGEDAQSSMRMRLVGANRKPRVSGVDLLPGHSNYFHGNNPKTWHTNIPAYARVEYREVYPGVNLIYYGNQRQLEYDFVVAPGADWRAIALAFEGTEHLALDASGNLLLRANGARIHLRKPVAYQERDSKRELILAKYVIDKKGGVRFEVALYDTTRPLIIDPVLVYSNYLGGSNVDRGEGIAIDAAGNAYVTGGTVSSNFPTTPGAFQTSNSGPFNVDAFVTKLNATGSALIYSTYLGGDGIDQGNGIAVDSAGNAYVIGRADSSNFPTTAGSFDTGHNGLSDVFVTKLNAAGNALVYSTFLGGIGNEPTDNISGLAVDGVGNAYVTGQTASNDFPTTSGAFDTTFGGGGGDAFVTKLNAAGSDLVYSTYLGDSGFDGGEDIAVDATEHAYVTGFTSSGNFPTTAGAFDTSFGGGDAFVTKFSPAGSALIYSTYLGSGNFESGEGIALDGFSNAHVTGTTSSPDFPTTPGAFDTTLNGGSDAFVAKLNAAGSALTYSTFLGGNSNDFGGDIAVDATTYVTGSTTSTNFPTTPGAFDRTLNGIDAFVTKLSSAGSALAYSTYLGGSNQEFGFGIAADAGGNAYVTGSTESTDFPTTAGAFDTTHNGGQFDAFVAKLDTTVSPDQQVTDLGDLIDTFNLPAGTANSLGAKVKAAQQSLANGNTTAACNQLQALINQAEAHAKSGKLSPAEAQAIINAAQAIRTALGCP